MESLLERMSDLAGGTEITRPPEVVAARLFAALLAGLFLGFVYRRTHTGVVFMAAIPQTAAMLAVGGALIWLVVGDNLVRAFGLAGMIGLIRYRTRISDPKDTTVFLFAMIIGMSCGLGQYVVAGLGAGFAGLTLIWLKVSSRWESDDTISAPGTLKDFLDDDLPDDGAAK